MLKIKSDNPNYLAKIVKMPELRPHPNADRLALVTIEGQVIITSKDATPGDLYVFMPLESKLNHSFLSFINGYSNPEINQDTTKKGFFSEGKRRVKATKLRGVLSEGYLHPVREFNEWLKSNKVKFQVTEDNLGEEFDYIDDILFIEKYINGEQLRKEAYLERQKLKGGRVAKSESRLIDNQFRFSPDYRQLKREIYNINPDDWIEITGKWHGCNAVMAKLLTKRKLSWVEKVAKFFGAQVKDSEYNLLYSSRRVLKSEEFRSAPAQSFYDTNVWQIVAERYQEGIQNGISLIGEIVGYTPTGTPIQKCKKGTYDYGCEAMKCEFIVFRINYTSTDGQVYEFSLQQVVDYCNKYGFKHVPVYYIGQAKNMYPELSVTEHWHENFLSKLQTDYLEKDCVYCKGNLPDEGIVLSKRVGGFEGLKLKSQKFLLSESDQLDTEEVSIEDQEALA